MRHCVPTGAWLRWCTGLLTRAPEVMRSRSLGAVDRRFGMRYTVRAPSGARLAVEGSDFGVVREIFGHRCYGEPAALADARTILDLGANAGIFTLYAASVAPHARIHAVEVQPDLCRVARANAERNGFAPRVIVENALVGGITTDWAREFIAHHPTIPVFNPAPVIEAWGGCDFVKCDVEGAEMVLLDGPPAWLRRVRRMAIEYHWNHEDGERLAARLAAAGCRVSTRRHGRLGYVDVHDTSGLPS